MMPVSFIGIVRKIHLNLINLNILFSGPTYHNIHALLQDGDKLYIGMYMGGLDIMDLKTGKFKNYKFGSSSRSLLCIRYLCAL